MENQEATVLKNQTPFDLYHGFFVMLTSHLLCSPKKKKKKNEKSKIFEDGLSCFFSNGRQFGSAVYEF